MWGECSWVSGQGRGVCAGLLNDWTTDLGNPQPHFSSSSSSHLEGCSGLDLGIDLTASGQPTRDTEWSLEKYREREGRPERGLVGEA